jgi:DNA-3-methyladenine glycosylase
VTPLPSLPIRFFERPCLDVARELLGSLLVRELSPERRLVARIVELEAYLGDGTDPASHAHRGVTPRNRSMFGPAGHWYVYRSMGIHHCMNVVCEPAGRASAVLLRAAAPLEGLEEMARARGVGEPRELCSGPGKLCQALGVTLEFDGAPLGRGPLRIARGERPRERIVVGPRIGLSRARELPYRFFLEGDPHVTRSPLNRRAQRCARTMAS